MDRIRDLASAVAIGTDDRLNQGGFIHILLVLAVVALVIQLVSGRRVV